jgi:diguanylate cyclase (GGDEF)-like protein
MGGALVAALALVVSTTLWALHLPPHTLTVTFAVLLVAVVIDAALLWLPWSRLSYRLLLVFPLLLLGTEFSLAATTDGVAGNYAQSFTLAFIFIGLTQPRGTSVVFALLAVPTWVYCQGGLFANVGVRLPIALAIWLVVGEVLAAHTASGKTRTTKLIAEAHTDVLTGLASRLVMSDRIDRSIARCGEEASSLLVLDLDGFKAINDAFGHTVGDELLTVVAKRIQASTSGTDLVARLGGDEFAVCLEGCEVADATQVGQRLLASLALPIDLSRGTVSVTASIGIIDLGNCATARDALRNADVAMYEAKLTGKNRLSVFESHMRKRIADRLRLGAELRTALDENQFEAYYQPTVQVETGEIVGFEALLRWHHPERGLLAAGSFIEVCEEVGLIVPLGTWILEQACRQVHLWQLEFPGRYFSMAVNLSSRQLFDTDLVAEVKAALSTSDLRGDVLVLEITERLLLVDSPFVLRQLDELKQLGVRIAIDDFGTGYSSLAYLRNFPIDILKIDRSFVEALDSDRQAVALAKSIVGIADALHLDVIAEGAETLAQVQVLADIGCRVIQGYYFGKPSSAKELSGCLATSQAVERISPVRSRVN